MQSRLTSLLLRVTLLGLSLTLVLLAGEGIMRVMGYRGPTYLEVENTIIVDDPILNWRHAPGSVFHFNNIEYRINAEGFRDRDHAKGRQPGITRVFLVSDSIGYGVNVQREDSYPRVLETLLNERAGRRAFDVINCSMPGMSLKQKLHLLRLFAGPYQPDLVLLDFCLNDAAAEMVKRPPREQEGPCTIGSLNVRVPCFLERALSKSALLFAVKQGYDQLMLRMGVEFENRNYEEVASDFYEQLYGDQERQQYLNDVFTGIARTAEELGVPVAMPVFPLIYDFENYKWNGIHALIEDLCRQNGILPIALLDDFSRFHYNEMRVQRGDFFHPSVEGNRLVAQAILDDLDRNQLVELPDGSEP